MKGIRNSKAKKLIRSTNFLTTEKGGSEGYFTILQTLLTKAFPDLNSTDKFLTDSNGRGLLERIRY
jgi:hypothetical protein